MASPAPAAGDSTAAAGASFLTLALQLLLILLVVRGFRLEEDRGLFGLLLLATVGALIHDRLAVRWRASFFLALSLSSFPLAFAWPSVEEAGWLAALATGAQQSALLIGLGLILIATCHLPLPFAGQTALLAAVVGALVAWRSEAILPFWAVLGSIFMFRLWIYRKAIRREAKAASWSQRLSYFFLFSNGFFPFFPIIDYRKFRDGCVANDAARVVMQRGVAWILRGIVHLLLYRMVKTFFLPGPMDLIDAEYLALFLVTNYALYLRISGHFHIITGLLHLFGYDLPRTHDRYFLASSLSDIWRRINIYWKDFLTDHVFFPAFFALRRLPKAAAVVVGVLVTFAATWLLHSWQVFWLLGDFPFDARDAALWLSAGTLVAINSVWQYRRALRRSPASEEVTVAGALRLSLQVVATFLTVSFFWACWTIPHFPQIVTAVADSGGFRSEQLLMLGGVLIGVVAVGTIAQVITDRLGRRGFTPSFPLERSPALCLGTLGLLTFAGMPAIQTSLGPRISPKLVALSAEAPTAAELGQDVEGYYEELAAVNLQADPMLGVAGHSQRRHSSYFDAVREREDIVEKELIPGWTGEVEGVSFRVNRWGMRDDDVIRRKPPNVFRVAVVGSSVTMGYGVAHDADFESIVERRVNEAIPLGGPHVEFLNFAMGQHDCLSAAGTLREKALPFDPDVAFFVTDQTEFTVAKRLAKVSYLGYPLPYPCLGTIIREAGVTETTSWGTTGALLQGKILEIVQCAYRGIVADCNQRGIVPVWIYLPMPGIKQVSAEAGELLKEIARDAGFVVIDLSSWTNGTASEELMGDDYHPNQLGHRVIADALFDALKSQPLAMPPLSTGVGQR